MKQVIKTIITVFVGIVCFFICLIAVFACYEQIDFLDYSIADEHKPVIIAAEAEYLGQEYNGETEDGFSYYRVYLTFKNKSNFAKNGSGLTIMYSSEDYDGNGDKIYRILTTGKEYHGNYDNTDYIPAGTESTYSEVISIEDGCKGFEVYLWDYNTEEINGIMVDL